MFAQGRVLQKLGRIPGPPQPSQAAHARVTPRRKCSRGSAFGESVLWWRDPRRSGQRCLSGGRTYGPAGNTASYETEIEACVYGLSPGRALRQQVSSPAVTTKPIPDRTPRVSSGPASAARKERPATVPAVRAVRTVERGIAQDGLDQGDDRQPIE